MRYLAADVTAFFLWQRKKEANNVIPILYDYLNNLQRRRKIVKGNLRGSPPLEPEIQKHRKVTAFQWSSGKFMIASQTLDCEN